MVKGLEHLLYKESGRAGSLQPGERKPRRDLVRISLSKNTAVSCAKKKESDFS